MANFFEQPHLHGPDDEITSHDYGELKFFTQVHKSSGLDLKIEYGQGGPDFPEYGLLSVPINYYGRLAIEAAMESRGVKPELVGERNIVFVLDFKKNPNLAQIKKLEDLILLSEIDMRNEDHGDSGLAWKRAA